MKKTMTSIMMLAMALAFSGCLTSITAETKKQLPDGSVTISRVNVFGTGDKVAESAAEGLFADGGDDVLGAGVRKASAKQESTGIAETFAGVGNMMTGMANFMAATQGMKAPVATANPSTVSTPLVTTPTVTAVASESEPATPTITVASLPTEASTAGSTALAAKIAEAKSSGKPLVVIAGSPACGFCNKFASVLDADATFAARTDIVLYREHAAWDTNGALRWTGGGNAPIVRVTRWTAGGAKTLYDTKLERPTVAEVEAAVAAAIAL